MDTKLLKQHFEKEIAKTRKKILQYIEMSCSHSPGQADFNAAKQVLC